MQQEEAGFPRFGPQQRDSAAISPTERLTQQGPRHRRGPRICRQRGFFLRGEADFVALLNRLRSAQRAQVLVAHDLLGLTLGRLPRHAKAYADLKTTVLEAAARYCEEVRNGAFPTAQQSFA